LSHADCASCSAAWCGAVPPSASNLEARPLDRLSELPAQTTVSIMNIWNEAALPLLVVKFTGPMA
jgi:hypothetical protein